MMIEVLHTSRSPHRDIGGQLVRYITLPDGSGAPAYCEREIFIPGGPVTAAGEQMPEWHLTDIPGARFLDEMPVLVQLLIRGRM